MIGSFYVFEFTYLSSIDMQFVVLLLNKICETERKFDE